MHVVLIDLDHTIVDHARTLENTAERLNSLARSNSAGIAPGDVFLDLQEHYRVLWQAGLADLRRNWLSAETLLVGTALWRRDIDPDLMPAWSELTTSREPTAAKIAAFATNLIQKYQTLQCNRSVYSSVNQLYEQLFEDPALIATFGDVDDLFRELAPLHRTTYILSDGARELQTLKFQRAGISSWIGIEHLITTEDIVPRGALAELAVYCRAVRQLLAIEHATTSSPRWREWLPSIESFINAMRQVQELLAGEVERALALERLWRGLVAAEVALSELTSKQNPRFLPAVLRAIAAAPDAPLSATQSMLSASSSKRLKLMMIGDRYDEDIYPALQLFGPAIVAIRVRRGKYASAYSEAELQRAGLPLPTYEVSNLREAGAVCRNAEVWAKHAFVRIPGWMRQSDQSVRADLGILLRFPPTSTPHRVGTALLAD